MTSTTNGTQSLESASVSNRLVMIMNIGALIPANVSANKPLIVLVLSMGTRWSGIKHLAIAFVSQRFQLIQNILGVLRSAILNA